MAAAGGKKIKIILQALGPVIFIYILSQINYGLFFAEIKTIKWPFLILVVGFLTLEVILKSFRWQTILSSLGIAVSRSYSIGLYWIGLLVGIITPGKFGELIKIYFLKTKGYSVFRSFFSIILDRLSDIFVLLSLGFLIFLFFLKDTGVYILSFGIIFVLIVIFIFLLINRQSWLHQIMGKFIQKFFSVDFNDYNRFTFKKLWQGIWNLEKEKIFYFFIYLIVSWLTYFLARYTVALSLGLDLSFIKVAIVSSLISIVTILPISIAGLGTREASVIYLFGLFGLHKEEALLFSLLIFTFDMIVISFGFIPYLKESALINQIKKDG
ncbi:MAG: lysylphosphatidylglycerol synthase transmembrane domain-containing protein [bacterium]|nr:lysylphosphatidylglycerol synthase transmembrane domain-containing protein [bacterium]